MYQLIYTSKQKENKENTISNILDKAHFYNKQHNLTGVLLHKGDIFIQLIEGEQSEVRNLFEQIKIDPIHEDVTILDTKENQERLYEKWSLFFHEIEDRDFKAPYSKKAWNLIEKSDLESISVEDIWRLIINFRNFTYEEDPDFQEAG